MEQKKNVLVTGVGGRSVGAGILHSLMRTGQDVRDRWNVIATDADAFSWGLYKADHFELLPFASHPSYMDRIKDVIHRYHIDAVIPGTQAEGEVLVENLQALGGIPVIGNRKELYPLMMDKFEVSGVLEELGALSIETVSLCDWRTIVNKYGFPIIIKPTRGTGASRGLHIVGDMQELENLLPFIDETTFPCVQPYISSGEDEYTVGVLTDKDGALIDSIVMHRKLLGLSLLEKKKVGSNDYAISTGYSQGFIIKDEKIQSFCENLAINLKSVGPLNIQLRVAQDKIFVFEIHPRFSGTTPIRADVGFNEVDLLLRNFLFDERFSRLDYTHNVAAIRAFEHVIVPMDKMG